MAGYQAFIVYFPFQIYCIILDELFSRHGILDIPFLFYNLYFPRLQFSGRRLSHLDELEMMFLGRFLYAHGSGTKNG